MEGEQQAALPAVNSAPDVGEAEVKNEEFAVVEATAGAAEEAAVAPAADGAQEPAAAATPAEEGAASEPATANGASTEAAAPAVSAGPEEKPAAREPPPKPTQIFFSGAPTTVKREDVEEIFQPYGKIVGVELVLDPATRQPRGSGFVRYADRQPALEAIAAMNAISTFPGGAAPMTVRLAEPDRERIDRKRKVEAAAVEEQGDPTEDQRQLFLAKITRSIPEEAIRGVLSHFGTVEGLRMYKLSPEAVYHKGCGVVTYSRREEADAAMRALDEIYVWEGMREAMVCKYNESESNKRRREEELRTGPNLVSLEPPPPGCDRDALKLYIGGMPTTATVEDIQATFKGFGRVVQITLIRDQASGEPKGAAHVWFQRRKEADLAVKRLNGSTTSFEAQPEALLVKLDRETVQKLRPGERPPAWMRAPGGPGGPPRGPYGGPPPRMGGPPMGWGMGGPPPQHYGGPPPPAGPGYGVPPGGGYGGPPPAYGQDPQAQYGAPAAGGYAAPQPQQAYQQASPAGAYPQQAYPQQQAYPPQQAYPAQAAAPQAAAPAYYQQAAVPAQGQQYAQQYQQPAAAAPQDPAYAAYYQQQQQAPAAGGYAAAPYGAPAQPAAGFQQPQQPVGGYGSYAPPAQQQQGYYQQQ